MATNGNVNHEYAAPAQTTEAPANAEGATNNLPKDEVGWYFVEQYYTTMSRSPERLHLYYGKRAQFVCGREAEVVNVSFGRQSIQERIKGMDYQDCKVRISNVDTQGSEEHILITVIGEMANKDGEPKKFVQTFVLAQQPSGYFVLNDMLRFLNDDVEEETDAAAEASSAPVEMPAAPEPEEKAEVAAGEAAALKEQEASVDSEAVTERLEEAAAATPASTEAAATEPTTEAEEAAPEEETQAQPDVEKTVEEIAEEEVKQPEEPKDPAPTPAVAPPPVRAAAPAPAPAQPEKPKEPPKPMSWASRVAAAAGAPRPVVPIPKTATPPAPAQARAPVPAAPQQAAPAAQAQESAPAPAAPKDQGSEWQTAETKRQSRAQPVAAPPPEKEGTMAYIKYVTDKVKEEDLKGLLTSFGELAYFDINRQKNCAFVEFKTQAGYTAALAANPHTVNGENIIVEQRRPKANAYGGANYNATRGGPGRGGRGGFEPSRSGSQSGGRGGFPGQTRGRGGGGPRGGRGASQVGTA